jgi:hypothetical protein
MLWRPKGLAGFALLSRKPRCSPAHHWGRSVGKGLPMSASKFGLKTFVEVLKIKKIGLLGGIKEERIHGASKTAFRE